jgi:hypothetical protein
LIRAGLAVTAIHHIGCEVEGKFANARAAE